MNAIGRGLVWKIGHAAGNKILFIMGGTPVISASNSLEDLRARDIPALASMQLSSLKNIRLQLML